MKTREKSALYREAPPELRERITAMARELGRQRHPRWISTLRLALVPVAAALVVFGFFSLNGSGAADKIGADVVASHVRSLMLPRHLIDVESSDKHTVKPWFNGKLDYSPSVVDLLSDGFPLAGGRLDYLSDRPVAALVYERHEHRINLFIWPSREADSSPRFLSRQGFSIFHWIANGMTYWAVSDLNANELKQFSELIRQKSS